jgi:hypothetical protein
MSKVSEKNNVDGIAFFFYLWQNILSYSTGGYDESRLG